jgi:hypothetical protein
MKKFIKNILVFGLVFFVLDKILIFFIIASPEKEVDKRLELVINGKINKEIVIFGSSRGARNIIASEIEKETGYSTYNLSFPGSDIEFHEFAVRSLLKFNKKPKVILLSIDYPMAFLPDSILNFRLDRLYPLVKYNYINDELVARGEKNLIMSNLLALSRMNKSNFNLRQKKFMPKDTVYSDGSMPIRFQKPDENWDKPKMFKKYNSANELKIKLEAFQKIIALCQENDIRLILISAPLFDPMDSAFKDRLRVLTSNKLELLESNSQNPIYKDKNYYYDRTHLNTKGATIFSNEIAQYLKSIKL